MEHLLFTQYAFSRLMPTILVLCIYTYMSLVAHDSKGTKYLRIYFFIILLFNFGNFFSYLTYHPVGAIGWYFSAFAGFALVTQMQFAYAFPDERFKKEARIVFVISFLIALYGLLEYMYHAHFADIVLGGVGFGKRYISRIIPAFIFLSYIWVIIVFFRKYFFYRKMNMEKQKNISLMFGLVVVIELLNAAFFISFAMFHLINSTTANEIMNIGIQITYFFFTALYFNYIKQNTPLHIKVAGLSAVTLLLTISIIGHVYFSLNRNNYIEEKKREASMLAHHLVQKDTMLYPNDLSYVVTSKGEYLYKKDADFSLPEKLRYYDKGAPTITKKELFAEKSDSHAYIGTWKENFHHVTIKKNGQKFGFGYAYLLFRLREHEIALHLLGVFLVALAIIIFLYPVFFAHMFIKPLNKLKDSFKKVDVGDLDIELDAPYNDELGDVTNGFNNMINSLRLQHAKLEEYSVGLEKLVEEKTIELKEAQQDEKIARKKAEEANRMKSQFLANVSHEIRTPMNAIMGFTRLLLSDDHDEETIEQLSIINSSSESLLNLINDILDFSKIEADKIDLNLDPFTPHSLILDLQQMFQVKTQQKGVDLNVSIEESVPKTLIGDKLRIQQVLINLIGNAVKFTKKGSINISAKYIGDSLILEIKDTGVGIAKDKLTYIFEPFQQEDGSTTRDFGGTGLGLAITKKLVELMNGTMQVASIKGTGSTFYITLPLPRKEKR